jgi:sulfate permease, SulP family
MTAMLKTVVKPSELLVPKTLSVMREGYGPAFLRADALAGLTVAIVALPLSMAIAIASHATPQTGLYTAIIGGFLISLLGGSRHQIGGPAGAFIKYVPHPVTVGFTAGVAVIIFSNQLREFLGLSLAGPELAALVPKLQALWGAAASINMETLLLALASIAVIVAIRIWQPRLPGFLIAVVLASLAACMLQLDAATIGTRFGGVPSGLPAPQLPVLSLAKVASCCPLPLRSRCWAASSHCSQPSLPIP